MFGGRARSTVLICIIALLFAGAAFLFIAFISLIFQPFRVTEKSFYHSDNGQMLVQEIFYAQYAAASP